MEGYRVGCAEKLPAYSASAPLHGLIARRSTMHHPTKPLPWVVEQQANCK